MGDVSGFPLNNNKLQSIIAGKGYYIWRWLAKLEQQNILINTTLIPFCPM